MDTKKIQTYFNTTGYPDFNLELRPGEVITAANAKAFIEKSILIINAHPDNPGYKPHIDDLQNYYSQVIDVRKVINKHS